MGFPSVSLTPSNVIEQVALLSSGAKGFMETVGKLQAESPE